MLHLVAIINKRRAELGFIGSPKTRQDVRSEKWLLNMKAGNLLSITAFVEFILLPVSASTSPTYLMPLIVMLLLQKDLCKDLCTLVQEL